MEKMKQMRSIALVSSMCAALASSIACHPAHSRHPVAVSDAEAVFVVGHGEAAATPDRMRLQLGVEAKAETLEAAMSDSTRRMSTLREALFKLGVAKSDLKTGQFSISQVREPVMVQVASAPPAVPAAQPSRPPGKPEKIVGQQGESIPMHAEERWVERYLVTNTLEVVYPDLTRAGELISAAVAAGANNSWGLNFELKDSKPLEARARAAAIEDARARAQEMAKATGVRLGRVLSVSDAGGYGGGPVPPMPMFKAAQMEAMPIEEGQTTQHASVQVVYAIERD